MTTIKHTPGPWAVGGHPSDNSGTNWREILAPGEFGPMYVGQALEADARLIAAAPRMLDLIMRLEAEGSPHGQNDQYPDGCECETCEIWMEACRISELLEPTKVTV